jgi:hypothetical protein
MNKPISVDQAINKGLYLINIPSLLIFIGFPGFAIYLVAFENFSDWKLIVGGILAGIVFMWLYWSVAITKWRIWAFSNVRNVHELKKRAIQEKLIWPDESIFVKTEIRTSRDKERLSVLEEKFNLEDEFYDDLSVPDETIIFYAAAKNFFEMIIMLVAAGGGVYAYKEFKEATNKTPQIILNDEGIQTISTPFYKWEQIRNEETVTEGYGKNSEDYLVYDHPEGSEHLLIEDYQTDKRSLNKLLMLYRGRSRHDSQQKSKH